MTTLASWVFFVLSVKVSRVHDLIVALSLSGYVPKLQPDCTLCCGLAGEQRYIPLPS